MSQASTHKDYNQLFEEVSRLSDSALEPDEYYAELLQCCLTGSGGLAGAVWVKDNSAGYSVGCHANLERVGIEAGSINPEHDQMLRQAVELARPMLLPPREETPTASELPINPTNQVVLLAPVLVQKQVVGLLELWCLPEPPPGRMATNALRFLAAVAQQAAIYYRNHELRVSVRQGELWNRLENFSQQIHASLDLTETAYTIANEGNRLAESDRLSVAVRRNGKVAVEAVSGVDTIEKRSRQVRLLTALCDRVLRWGERLVYRGKTDETLPAKIVKALDEYVAESDCRFLIVEPLREPRARSSFALVLECFDARAEPALLIERLEVIGRHAHAALRNATKYRSIPLRWLWRPVGALRDAFGGPAGSTFLAVTALLAAGAAALICLPAPLKLDATGQLLPRERRWLYAPVEGQVVRFGAGVEPGAVVDKGQALVLMHDTDLELDMVKLSNDVARAQDEIVALSLQHKTARTEAERLDFSARKKQKEFERDRKLAELKALRERTGADEARPGYFWLKAPLAGSILNGGFHENLQHRFVRPSDPLLRLGDRQRGWEIETRIPHHHVGKVLEALAEREVLDVDVLLLTRPTQTFKGKLSRQCVEAEAKPDENAPAGTPPTVRALVRVDGDDIPAAERVPPELLLTGTEVHLRIRCGDRPMVYTLFHGVWEFLYEKVLFF